MTIIGSRAPPQEYLMTMRAAVVEQFGKPLVLRKVESVCAIDIDDGKLAHAKRLGADVAGTIGRIGRPFESCA